MFNKICENCGKRDSEYLCSFEQGHAHWAGTCSNWYPQNDIVRDNMLQALRDDLNKLKENKFINFGAYERQAKEFAHEARLAGLNVCIQSIRFAYIVKLV